MTEPSGFYGKLLPSFFYGTTGMSLQSAGAIGKDALILAAFLMANEWASMIGLYELSIQKLARKLPVLKARDTSRAFALLDKEQFAYYDEETEIVWVREMARVRINLIAGQVIANPRQRTAAQNCYYRVPLNPFLGPFYDRYHVELDLKNRRDWNRGSPNTSANGSANGSPTTSVKRSVKASANGSVNECQVPVHQVPVQAVLSTQESVQVQQQRTAAGPQLFTVPVSDPDPEGHYAVIAALVTKDILPLRLEDHRLMDVTMARCIELRIEHNESVVRKAIDSALFRYYRKMRLDNDLPGDPRGIYHDHVRPRSERAH